MSYYAEIESRVENAKTLEEITASLEELISGPYSVWMDGRLYSIKQIVAKINGLRIDVFAKEHAPPHFHVSGNGIDATFSVLDCSLNNGVIGGREKSLVEWWHKRSRNVLIKVWNKTRPSDCPVGPIHE